MPADGTSHDDIGVRRVEGETEDFQSGLQDQKRVNDVDVFEVPQQNAEFVALEAGGGSFFVGIVFNERIGYDF